jgi:DHA1 family bicyclomycin/chloramphenicol resistance-like MFS transporter
LTPTQYSLAFSVNAIGFIGASQFAGTLGGRFGMGRTVLTAVSLYAGFAVLLFALTLLGFDSLRVLIPLLFTSFAFLGLVIPSTMVLALERHGPIAGIAAALGGTLQMVTGGAMIAVAGLLFDGTTLPMVATIAFTAVAALLVSVATLRTNELAATAAE